VVFDTPSNTWIPSLLQRPTATLTSDPWPSKI